MKQTFVLVALAATLAACGGDANGASNPDSNGTRSIDVAMTDMAFAPATIDVAAGETVTFTIHNDGAVRHEAVVGDEAQQAAHHAEMAEMGGQHDMESMGHDGDAMSELHMVAVEPGETVEMTHTFETAGEMVIGCHEPGHWEAGMKMGIAVA